MITHYRVLSPLQITKILIQCRPSGKENVLSKKECGTVHFSSLTSSRATIMDGALLQVVNTAKADTLLKFDDALRAVTSEKDEAVECARVLKEEEV